VPSIRNKNGWEVKNMREEEEDWEEGDEEEEWEEEEW
jgi:hypothetical protein